MNTGPNSVREGFFLNDDGRRVRTRRTSIVSRHVEVLQDLLWHELVTAAQMTDRFDDIEARGLGPGLTSAGAATAS